MILTTGDVARICKVAPRTASKWIDSGLLPGYRIGKDRRVTVKALHSFLRANGMFVSKVLVVSQTEYKFGDALACVECEVEWATTPFEAGLKSNVDLILVDKDTITVEIKGGIVVDTISAAEIEHVLLTRLASAPKLQVA